MYVCMYIMQVIDIACTLRTHAHTHTHTHTHTHVGH
jgi:hypothetical protein